MSMTTAPTATDETRPRTPDLWSLLGEERTAEYQAMCPDGHVLGWRSINPDFTSSHNFRWPWPGQVAKAPTTDDMGRDLDLTTTEAPNEACPGVGLGGLCLAKTWSGAKSGGVPLHMVLIVAYRSAHLLGQDADKIRIKQAHVLDLLDVRKHIRVNGGFGANLGYANLFGANLRYADLRFANLFFVNLCFANLHGVNLRHANLHGVNLRYANLDCADLRRANLRYADLRRADLRRADLRFANLDCADLSEARGDEKTWLPPGFKVAANGLVVPVA